MRADTPILPALAFLVGLFCAAFPAAGPSLAAVSWDPSGAESLNVTILGFYPVVSSRGHWACATYVAPGGHEYGILGADSLHIVDLADPERPRRAAVIPPAVPPADNFYVHTAVRGRYAYAAGRFGPIRIIDLANPESPVIAGEIPRSEFCACSCGHPCNNPSDPHQPVIETIWIDERGILYAAGISCGDGMHMYDLAADPVHPPWLCHEHTHPPGTNYSFYAHDVHARNSLLYVSRSRQPQSRWDILDGDPLCPDPPGSCGNGQVPQFLSWFPQDGSPTHAHSCWRVEDTPYLTTCDEMTNGHIRIWDVGNPSAPMKVADFQPDGTCHSVHNVYFKGQVGYAAWYNKGIQIFGLAGGPAGPGLPGGRPYRIGWYEHPIRWHTQPADPCCDPTIPGPSCYGVPYIDPFFPSGIFVATEIDGGLLVGRLLIDPAAAGGGARADPGGSLLVIGLPGARPLRILWTPRGATRPDGPAALGIVDAAGSRVARLLPTQTGGASRSIEYRWDGRDDRGRPLPSGLYFARPETGGAPSEKGKLIVLE